MKTRQSLALFVIWGAIAGCAVLALLAPIMPAPAAKGEGLAGALAQLQRTAF
jgi:hypothetical protein